MIGAVSSNHSKGPRDVYWWKEKIALLPSLLLITACFLICEVIIFAISSEKDDNELNFTVMCASSDDDARHRRWRSSAELWGVRGETLGWGRKWDGFGTKLHLLREKLKQMIDAGIHEHVVMYTDSYDVMFVGPLREVLRRFSALPDVRILFGCETVCWPDPDERKRYPTEDLLETYSYLNAGVLIGYVSTLWELVTIEPLRGDQDDQRYYTKMYLNSSLRERLRITLDHKADIIQSLHKCANDLRVVSEPGSWAYLNNTLTGTRPLVLHGNGPKRTKDTFSDLVGVLVRAWVTRKDLAPGEHYPKRDLNNILSDLLQAVTTPKKRLVYSS